MSDQPKPRHALHLLCFCLSSGTHSCIITNSYPAIIPMGILLSDYQVDTRRKRINALTQALLDLDLPSTTFPSRDWKWKIASTHLPTSLFQNLELLLKLRFQLDDLELLVVLDDVPCSNPQYGIPQTVGISGQIVWAFAHTTLAVPVRKYIGRIGQEQQSLVDQLDTYEKAVVVDGSWRYN